jgi:hypothetical protein
MMAIQLVIAATALKVLMAFIKINLFIFVRVNRCKPINIKIIERRKILMVNNGAGLFIKRKDDRNIKHASTINIEADHLLSGGFDKFIHYNSF